MKKRIFSLFLALALLLSVLPTAFAAEETYSFIDYLTTDQTFDIAGYTGTLPEKLVIPETINGYPVRSIREGVFSNATIKEVVLPGTIEKLNSAAFSSNATLERVTIGEGTKIIQNAFQYCKNLKEVKLPATLETVDSYAFMHTGLTEVELPAGLKTIGMDGFAYSQLRSVTLPEGLTYIGQGAFAGNPLEGTVTVPASVTYLHSAFRTRTLSELVILSDTIKLQGFPCGHWTFAYAHENVWKENTYAAFPENHAISFEELPYDYFSQPTYIENGICYTTVDGTAYVIWCSASGTVVVPETLGGCPVKELLPSAFSNCNRIDRLTLPDSIERIGRKCFVGCNLTIEKLPENLKDIGVFAFCGDSSNNKNKIPDCTIPEGITKIPTGAFEHTQIDKIVLPAGLETVGAHAFSDSGAKELVFSGSVKEIRDSAFYGIQTKEIVLPEGLETLGQYVFNGPSQLEKITFPKTIKTLGEWPFGYDPSEKLTVYGYADTPVLDYCLNAGITFVDRETGKTAEKIYKKEIDGVEYRVNPTKDIAEIISSTAGKQPEILVIPDHVDGHPVTAIQWCGLHNITSGGLVLPDTITFIDDKALGFGKTLKFVSMPNNKAYIDQDFIDYSAECYYVFPENFALSEECSAYAGTLFKGTCIGYEKHRPLSWSLIAIDDHADSQHLLTTGGVFRVDGEELTAIHLVTLAAGSLTMPSTINDLPITKIEATCTSTDGTIVLGDYVRVVEEGALNGLSHSSAICELYVPDCIEYLPPTLFTQPSAATIYGKTGTYAEQYAKQHGIKFADMEKTPFTDVPESEWYFQYIRPIYWLHIMNGTSETTFEPEATTTRAMVVQVLYNLSDRPWTSYVAPFTDVREGSWYYDAVNWAWAAGVCNGTSETQFSPNDPVTREQLAAFLYRYAKLCGFDCREIGSLSDFRDSGSISGYAREAIQWAVGAGIINGITPTTIEPGSYATRAEIATMLYRFLEYVANNADIDDEY